MKFYYATNIFDLQIFDNEKTNYFLKFAQNPFFFLNQRNVTTSFLMIECVFFSLSFLNERNIKTSFLIIHLKCTVVYHINLSSSSINKSFSNDESRRICYFVFFDFLFMFLLKWRLSKTLWQNYNVNFRNLFQDIVYYRILGWQTLRQ